MKFKYEIKLVSGKIEKKITLDKLPRKLLHLDESRVWNMKNTWVKNKSNNQRIAFLIGYVYEENILKRLLGITGSSFNLSTLTPQLKNETINTIANYHVALNITSHKKDQFYSSSNNRSRNEVITYIDSKRVTRWTDRINRLFAPNFYHDRRDKNFLKGLTFVGKKADTDEENFSEFPSVLGRQLYEYKINPSNKRVENIPIIDLDWPFPDKYYKSIGFAINRFDFCFKNLPVALTNILDPSPNLINTETNTEQIDNTLTLELFANKKNIEDIISEYNAIPTKNLINESFFFI